MMNDVTKCFRLYRECARAVWNAYLREYDDGEHGFSFVDAELFNAMVASQFEKYEKATHAGDLSYYPLLKIMPRVGDQALSALRAEVEGPVGSERVRWVPATYDDLAELRYTDLFDFVPFSGEFREFKYVEAVALASESTPARGDRILVEATEIRLIDISQPVRY